MTDSIRNADDMTRTSRTQLVIDMMKERNTIESYRNKTLDACKKLHYKKECEEVQ